MLESKWRKRTLLAVGRQEIHKGEQHKGHENRAENHRHSSPIPGRRSRANHHLKRQARPDVHGSIMYNSQDMDEG